MTNNLTVVGATGAVTKQNLPPFKAYGEFQDLLDVLKRQNAMIARYTERFEKYPAGRVGGDDFLVGAQEAMAHFDKVGPKHIAEAEAAAKQFDIEGIRDENGDLKKSWIAAKVSELVGSFPQAGPANPESYVPMLINELMADGYIDVIELEMTVRSVRRTSKFIPTISEVLAAKKKVNEEWCARFEAIEYLQWNADELRRLIEEAKPIRLEEDERRAAEQLAQEQRQAAWRLEEERKAERRSPIKAGDRVHEAIAGPCTVSDVVFDPEYREWVCEIAPDAWHADDGCLYVAPHLLRKLIAGDTGFEHAVTKEDEKL